jgi:hypothetical protein
VEVIAMKMSELAVLFGIFVLIFFSASTFLTSFQVEQQLPSDIFSGWNATKNQVEEAREKLNQTITQFQGSNPLQQIANSISIAFGLVQYLAVVAYSTLVTIPSAVWGAVNYMSNYFGIPDYITSVIIGLLTVFIVIKMIEFLTGRQGL